MTQPPTVPPRPTAPRRGSIGRSRAALLGALLGALLATPLAAQPAALDDFDAYVQRAVDDWEAPGLAVSVVHRGEIVFERGYGVLELGGSTAADEHSLFAIGSTTKALTAALIGMLVDEGRLGWDDPVIDHLPDFRLKDPVTTREVRVRDLLTHNAGLPNADYLWYEQDHTTEEIVRRLRYVEPAYSLRSAFVYQNVMYAAAGELLEAVTGSAWSELVRARIFTPLGMTRSAATLAETRDRAGVARPHDLVDGRLAVIENASVDTVAPAGSIWSSVHDMAQWMRLLLAGGVTPDGRRLLAEQTLAELFTPQTMVGPEDFYPTARLTRPHWTTYGLGWFQTDYEGRRVDFHTGSIDGMVAICGLIRDESLGVYVLANRDHAELRHALMYRVFDLFDDQPPRDWSSELRELYAGIAEERWQARQAAEERRVEGTAPSLPLERYVGGYRDPLYGAVEVALEEGALAVRYGRRAGPAEHWHYDTFRVHWSARWRRESGARFVIDATGAVAELELDGLRFAREP
ncbi:MAG TPA: serine hydrolase [Thermoanaerobaculia bacterium]|nr:serine hydrolase [Thermoanaerobaculia bacterium]